MNLLIWGKGGHASVVADTWLSRYNNAHLAFLDDSDDPGSSHLYPPEEYSAFVGIGDNDIRERICNRLAIKYKLATVIAPSAYISPRAVIAPGTFIGPQAVVQTGAAVGYGTIINTGATVDHDCDIGAFAHIAPGVNLCGNVTVGFNTLIGVGSSVIPMTVIGKNSIVAGGSSVCNDLDSNGIYAGNPAKYKRSR